MAALPRLRNRARLEPLIVQSQPFGLLLLPSWGQCMYYCAARSHLWCVVMLGGTLVVRGAARSGTGIYSPRACISLCCTRKNKGWKLLLPFPPFFFYLLCRSRCVHTTVLRVPGVSLPMSINCLNPLRHLLGPFPHPQVTSRHPCCRRVHVLSWFVL